MVIVMVPLISLGLRPFVLILRKIFVFLADFDGF